MDDESWIATTVVKWLTEAFASAEVRWVRGNYEALKTLESFTPTLIITDYLHPDGTGRQLLDKLRKHPKTQDVPVVLLSARSDVGTGFDAALTQIVGYKEFMDTINGLLRL